MAFKSLALALAALSFHRVSAFTRLQARDGNDPYPFCNPATSPDCIVGGKYVKPDLNISDEPNAGNQAYLTYLPTHTYTLSQWSAGKYPEECHRTIAGDGFNPTDFTVHNVTYSDCPSSPWVICVSRLANKTPVQIATEVGRMPAGIRQATAAYVVYDENFGGAIGAVGGLIIGKGSYYFPTALVHEHGHAVDGDLLAPNDPFSYSDSAEWRNTVALDGYAATAYGSTAHAENFADIGRVVLINNVVPGGLAGLFPTNPNLTQIANQVARFQSKAGSYYQAGTTCDLSKKYRYPSVTVTVPTTTAAPTATASPYGQCGGWPATYTGVSACGAGYSCTTLNPHYAQCTPAPVRRSFMA
ncbi:hypothetical protein B0T18DRAFT_387525 [Schizothecium vesticola]|uniref:CBM1 domain-containing protein n=1 Tax=Schizothecium vesticola TaxID=314040 RepID=A0AA40F550_9PEZI|nr:hypothetical protein B0T18DRAFT_387525 [Schizothecium vesticola]